MTQPAYRHTQVGYLTIAALGAALVLIAVLTVSEFYWVGLVVFIVLAACLVVFASLTVELDGERLRLWFGPGLIRKSFPLREIEAARPVTNPVWYGWGIHLTPAGWVYNVSGLRAVEVLMKNGRRVRVGTDEPEALALAIEGAVRAGEG
jgi:hypothetical protein